MYLEVSFNNCLNSKIAEFKMPNLVLSDFEQSGDKSDLADDEWDFFYQTRMDCSDSAKKLIKKKKKKKKSDLDGIGLLSYLHRNPPQSCSFQV